jgi:hypothetical protein
MDSTAALIMLLCLGVGLIAAVVGLFLFNGFDWRDWF